MKRLGTIRLTLLLTLGACSNEMLTDPTAEKPKEVAFDVYMGTQQTRAGATGEITTESLKSTDYLFGVYAYYTREKDWSHATEATEEFPGGALFPNFMYNQRIEWQVSKEYDADGNEITENTTGSWEYSPAKYWPNGAGLAQDDGMGKTEHKVSFFAYAPYAELAITDLNQKDDPTTEPASGITAINGTLAGGPQLTYKLKTEGNGIPMQQVDLLWGSGTDGNPLTDRTKQDVTGRLTIDFHHALSCIDVYVERVFNGLDTDKTPVAPATTDSTKIFVSGFTLDGNVATEGKMNLIDGTWTTVGQADSKFGVTTADIAADLRGTTADDLATVTAVELQDFETRKGVTGEATRLTTMPIMFIPNGTMTVTPTLKYNFVTHDDDLILSLERKNSDQTKSYFGRIMNTVAATTPVSFSVEPGKRYKLLCRIGIESVELGVSNVDFEVIGVEDWDFPMRFNPTVPDFRTVGVTEVKGNEGNEYGSYKDYGDGNND